MIDDRDLDRRLARLRSSAEPAPWKDIEARLRSERLIAAERLPARNLFRHLVMAALYMAVGVGAGVTIAGVPSSRTRSDFSEGTGGDSSSVMRLAALQAIVLTTGQALREVPGDSLIARYHYAARAQRDALLGETPVVPVTGQRWY